MSTYILVRSPSILAKDDLIGYGWENVNFSNFSDAKELIHYFKKNAMEIGRSKNQIRRFFNIKNKDKILVPVSGAVLIGVATGQKSYSNGIKNGNNQITVNFLRTSDGNLKKIPRNKLSTALSSRLRIRQTVVSLEEFGSEIDSLLSTQDQDGATVFDSNITKQDAANTERFKKRMLENIQHGKTFLESGGIGLEKLVLELLRLEGYEATIVAKSKYAGIADVDIAAFKTDFLSSTKLLIQVKHHSGSSGFHGIRQIAAVEDEEQVVRWLITTAEVSDENREKAKAKDVRVMDGEEFVDWLAGHAASLSPATRNRLAIATMPALLAFSE